MPLLYLPCRTPEHLQLCQEFFSGRKWARPVLMQTYNANLRMHSFWEQLSANAAEWRFRDRVGVLYVHIYDKNRIQALDDLIQQRKYNTGYMYLGSYANRKQLVPIITKLKEPVIYPTEVQPMNWMCTPSQMERFLDWFSSVERSLLLQNSALLQGSVVGGIRPMANVCHDLFADIQNVTADPSLAEKERPPEPVVAPAEKEKPPEPVPGQVTDTDESTPQNNIPQSKECKRMEAITEKSVDIIDIPEPTNIPFRDWKGSFRFRRKKTLADFPRVKIFILCPTAEKFERAIQEFKPFYWAVPILMKYQNASFENAFWLQLLEMYDTWKDSHMVGTLGYRARDKVRLEMIDNIVREPLNWKNGFYHFYYHNISMLIHVETSHPGLKPALLELAKQLNIPLAKQILACNYWMTTPSKMKGFLDWWLNVLKPTVEAHPIAFCDSKYVRPGGLTEEQLLKLTGKPYYPMLPFIYERLNCSYFFMDPNPPSVVALPKTLVLYVFHRLTESVQFFLKNGLFESDIIDFLLLVNSSDLQLPNLSFKNVTVQRRENKGYDFGAWSDGLFKEDRYKRYDTFIFVNASVIGPFEREAHSWPRLLTSRLTDQDRLVGTTINCVGIRGEVAPHVQSMVFAVTQPTLKYLMQQGIFVAGKYETDFITLIDNYEVGMSRKILADGWNIAALQSTYAGVDFRTYDASKGTNNINRDAGEVRKYVKSPYDIVFAKSHFKNHHAEESQEDVSWIYSWVAEQK